MQALPSRNASSKYDFVKVKVRLGENADHYYVLSMSLLSRMLTVTKVVGRGAAAALSEAAAAELALEEAVTADVADEADGDGDRRISAEELHAVLASLGDAACSVPPFARNPPQPAPDPRSVETQPTPTHSLRRPIPTRPNIAQVKTRPKKTRSYPTH